MRSTVDPRRLLRGVASTALLLGAFLLVTSAAEAACGCAGGGVPNIKAAKMRGNDLNELSGTCAPPNAEIELTAYQQHIKGRKICPPECPSSDIYRGCINQCRHTVIARTRSDAAGRFTFRNIDADYSLQLIATQPSQPNGLDGVFTALRVRTRDPRTGQWSADTPEPYLEAFNLGWPGYEGGIGFVETRVSGATKVHVTVADGPDDGDQPAIALDVDEDTPNFWLRDHPTGTVQYTSTGSCNPSQGCPAEWHVLQSPSISVQSPPLGRGSEYPWVLGMVSASRPGAMLIATSIAGPRSIEDVSVHVDVDVDLDLGFSFFSIF